MGVKKDNNKLEIKPTIINIFFFNYLSVNREERPPPSPFFNIIPPRRRTPSVKKKPPLIYTNKNKKKLSIRCYNPCSYTYNKVPILYLSDYNYTIFTARLSGFPYYYTSESFHTYYFTIWLSLIKIINDISLYQITEFPLFYKRENNRTYSRK
jgi:hypothetical protein